MSARGCPGHSDLGTVLGPEVVAELRQYAGQALDLLQPWVDRVREQPAAPAEQVGPADGGGSVCASCPVCAALTVLRGGRPELVVRLAEQAAGLLTVLRIALDEGLGNPVPPSAAPPPARSSPPARRVVQHIGIARDGGERWDGAAAAGPC